MKLKNKYLFQLLCFILNGIILKLNILDTPGYTDFIGEVKAAMRVCDTAVMVLKSAEGVEVGSETTGTL